MIIDLAVQKLRIDDKANQTVVNEHTYTLKHDVVKLGNYRDAQTRLENQISDNQSDILKLKTKIDQFIMSQKERNFEFDNRINKVEESCKDNLHHIKKMTYGTDQLADNCKNFEEILLSKTSYIDFKNLKNRFEIFSEVESIHALETIFLPKI